MHCILSHLSWFPAPHLAKIDLTLNTNQSIISVHLVYMCHSVILMFLGKSYCNNNVILMFLGERALRQILEDSRRIADRCVNPEDRDSIARTASNIESMLDALCELRQQGKVCHVISIFKHTSNSF